jgi:hypothetical protein
MRAKKEFQVAENNQVLYKSLPENREDDLFVAFHLGGHKFKKGVKRWLVTKIVRIFSRPKVKLEDGRTVKITHTEIVFPLNTFGLRNMGRDYSFSSDGFDGGVRFKYIDYRKHPERWVFIKVPQLTTHAVDELLDSCSKVVGRKYDYLGVITYFGVRFFKKENPKRWWCSEVDASRLWGSPDKISPARMFKMLYNFQKKMILKHSGKSVKCANLRQFFILFKQER